MTAHATLETLRALCYSSEALILCLDLRQFTKPCCPRLVQARKAQREWEGSSSLKTKLRWLALVLHLLNSLISRCITFYNHVNSNWHFFVSQHPRCLLRQCLLVFTLMGSGYQIVPLLRRLPILIPFSQLLIFFSVMRPALHQRIVLEVQKAHGLDIGTRVLQLLSWNLRLKRQSFLLIINPKTKRRRKDRKVSVLLHVATSPVKTTIKTNLTAMLKRSRLPRRHYPYRTSLWPSVLAEVRSK